MGGEKGEEKGEVKGEEKGEERPGDGGSREGEGGMCKRD